MGALSYKERAEKVIAQGTSPYSKRWDQYIEGVTPTHAQANTFDTLTDFVGALGANLIDVGNSFSLPYVGEVHLAERLVELFPIDKLKFLKTGSEACSAAVRIARAYSENTAKLQVNSVLGSGYHGWHNMFIAAEDPGCGCAPGGYQKVESLERIIHFLNENPRGYCAVIIEPVQLDINVKPQLQEIRRLCDKNKIVLIFDETITALRFPKYCVANYFGIRPDIMCFGKALGGGHALNVVGGRKEIMDTPASKDDYFISSTFSGERQPIDSAIQTLDFLKEHPIEALWEKGKQFLAAFNGLSSGLQIVGYPTRGELRGEYKDLFMQQMCKKGYLFGKAWFLMYAHTEEIIQQTYTDASDTLIDIERGKVKLEGKPSQEVFRRNA